MLTVTARDPYVLVVSGRVIASSSDVTALLNAVTVEAMGYGVVKPWREHQWTPGVPGSVHDHEHCAACYCIRPKRALDHPSPCPFPERLEESLPIFNTVHEHVATVCCPEHNHHVAPGYAHRNCVLR